MQLKEFIERALDALQQQYYRVLKGLTDSELTWQPCPNANSIGFIFWHVTRVEDRLIVHFAQGKPEVWIRDGWYQRWGIPEKTTGLEYPPEQIAGFPVPALKEMQAYFEAVRNETLTYLKKLDAKGFELLAGKELEITNNNRIYSVSMPGISFAIYKLTF